MYNVRVAYWSRIQTKIIVLYMYRRPSNLLIKIYAPEKAQHVAPKPAQLGPLAGRRVIEKLLFSWKMLKRTIMFLVFLYICILRVQSNLSYSRNEYKFLLISLHFARFWLSNWLKVYRPTNGNIDMKSSMLKMNLVAK